MKLRIYSKDTDELVYFCNTTGDPYNPDTIEDGGSEAGRIRNEMEKLIKSMSPVIISIVGDGDYTRVSAALTLYKNTHKVEFEDLPERPEPKLNRRYERFCQE